jgi:hypothetical protein
MASRRVTARCPDADSAKVNVSVVTITPATRAMEDFRNARVGKFAVAG